MSIQFLDFQMDKSIVAQTIYGTSPHNTTNKGVVISQEARQEFKHFLYNFNITVGIERLPYYRIDAYFDDEFLWILEINASFVDGWGTALNLARSSNISIDPARLEFPKRFSIIDNVYRPELELLVSEFDHLGLNSHSIQECNCDEAGRVYVYGRVGWKDCPHVLPYDGLRLDNKLNLGLFSRKWDGDFVKVPQHFISRFEPWEEIPQNAVLKFCDKSSNECEKARTNVIFGKPFGKAPFIKQCYRDEALLAQNFVSPAIQDNKNCQLVILAIGDEPITGYVQYSNSRMINDNSTHGPLLV